jgi:hypothetical protein
MQCRFCELCESMISSDNPVAFCRKCGAKGCMYCLLGSVCPSCMDIEEFDRRCCEEEE